MHQRQQHGDLVGAQVAQVRCFVVGVGQRPLGNLAEGGQQIPAAKMTPSAAMMA